ncbi:hypothetical protein HK099_006989 [Clydaea vesicula]|uniref:NADP-dependent oxidoreductase domain-containing protein n=1 Tax=Clydaea vesicula TaxID=447962 RepID=A0AAD5TWY0_9FUNG|nr:hypothetical protein HK099_006989 [Clydaea vesicula]
MKVVLGTMTFGTGVGGRLNVEEKIKDILIEFKKYGDELDTARMYCDGNTEEVLGAMGVSKEPFNFKIATKVYPALPGMHSPENLKETFSQSLKALKTNYVEIFYLHAPDHGTPFAVTLKAVDELYKAGHFKYFALSNFAAWEVMQIYSVCSIKFLFLIVVLGMYNALTRNVESELFPCIRELGIKFYAYNPICGGVLSGRYTLENFGEEILDGSRFDQNTTQGKRYRERYWNKLYFEAVEDIKKVCAKYKISLPDAAHRWLSHHSKLDEKLGDAIIVGVSSLEHAITNLRASVTEEKLPYEVVAAFDDFGWDKTKSMSVNYFR